MRLALFAVLLLPVALGCTQRDRYEVIKRRVGNEDQLVRIDRATGRTEIVERDGSWRVVEEQPTAAEQASTDAAVSAAMRSFEERLLDASELQAVAVTGGLAADRFRLVLNVHNKSKVHLTELSAQVTHRSATEIYKQECHIAPNEIASVTFDLRTPVFAEEPIGWRVAQIKGW